MTVIDKATFEELRQMSGDDFIDELIDAFLEDSPNMIGSMRAALLKMDVEVFRRNAHSLKSNAQTFGATELAMLAKELEFMARDNNLEVGNRLEVLEVAYGEVERAFKELRV
jgi:histidine phosphotransfer protein HptB